MESLAELFLSPPALERLLIYMCKSSAGSQDPISESARALLTCQVRDRISRWVHFSALTIIPQVQFSASRYGVGILKGQPVFPYCYMTAEQRQWIYELIRAISGGENHHSAFARRDDPLTYTVSSIRKQAHRVQLGLKWRLHQQFRHETRGQAPAVDRELRVFDAEAVVLRLEPFILRL